MFLLPMQVNQDAAVNEDAAESYLAELFSPEEDKESQTELVSNGLSHLDLAT